MRKGGIVTTVVGGVLWLLQAGEALDWFRGKIPDKWKTGEAWGPVMNVAWSLLTARWLPPILIVVGFGALFRSRKSVSSDKDGALGPVRPVSEPLADTRPLARLRAEGNQLAAQLQGPLGIADFQRKRKLRQQIRTWVSEIEACVPGAEWVSKKPLAESMVEWLPYVEERLRVLPVSMPSTLPVIRIDAPFVDRPAGLDGAFKHAELSFAHVRFMNDPPTPAPTAVAEDVIATVSFHDAFGSPVFPSYQGNWVGSVYVPIKIPIGGTAILNLAIKYLPMETACAYSDDSWGHGGDEGLYDPSRQLRPGLYEVRVRLRGTRFDNTFRFSLENPGADRDLIIRQLSPNP